MSGWSWRFDCKVLFSGEGRSPQTGEHTMRVLAFFLAHWMLAGFAQTFFLHRYGSHRMFRMGRGVGAFSFTFSHLSPRVSSYLNPRAYAILHRLHHAHADTPDGPPFAAPLEAREWI